MGTIGILVVAGIIVFTLCSAYMWFHVQHILAFFALMGDTLIFSTLAGSNVIGLGHALSSAAATGLIILIIDWWSKN